MNKSILQKCIEELKKPRPNKQYVLGMLEALVDIEPTHNVAPGNTAKTIAASVDTTLERGKDESAKGDVAGEVETPEQRAIRLGTRKVPPAFLGRIDKMSMDPSKTDGKTDVTQFN